MKLRYSFAAHFLSFATAFLAIGTEALQHKYYTRHDERSLIGPLGFPFGFLETGHFNITVFDFHLEPTTHEEEHVPHDRSLAKKKDKDSINPCLPSGLCLNDVLKKIKGVGFLLKQFDDEAHFLRYMAQVEADGTCIFQKFLDRKKVAEEDDYLLDDNLFPNVDDDFAEYEFNYDNENEIFYPEGYDNMDDYYGYNDDGFGYTDDGPRSRRRALGEGKQGAGEITNDVVNDGLYLNMLDTKRWRPNHAFASYDFGEGQAGFYFLMYQVCYKTDDELAAEDLDETKPLYHIHSRFALKFHSINKDRFGHVSYLSSGEMVSNPMYF